MEIVCKGRRHRKCHRSSEVYSLAKLQVTFNITSMRDHVAADLRQFHRLKMLNEGPRCDWVFNRFKHLPFLIKTFNNFTLKEGGRKLSDRKSEVDSSQIIFDQL